MYFAHSSGQRGPLRSWQRYDEEGNDDENGIQFVHLYIVNEYFTVQKHSLHIHSICKLLLVVFSKKWGSAVSFASFQCEKTLKIGRFGSALLFLENLNILNEISVLINNCYCI